MATTQLSPCRHRKQDARGPGQHACDHPWTPPELPITDGWCACRCLYPDGAARQRRRDRNPVEQAIEAKPVKPSLISKSGDDARETLPTEPVTVAVPMPEILEGTAVALELWRLQTVKPRIVLVCDGGFDAEHLRAPDCEVHYLRFGTCRHPSFPVAAMLDLAQAVCQTPYLLHTHNDLFPRRRDLLEHLMNKCRDEKAAVVGYRMSQRGDPRWAECVSHTCTMLYMPVIRRVGACWGMEAYFDQEVPGAGRTRPPWNHGWPDTESGFWLSLKRAGIKPVFIGDDANYVRYVDDNIDHMRSMSSSYHRALREQDMKVATNDARERLDAWTSSI